MNDSTRNQLDWREISSDPKKPGGGEVLLYYKILVKDYNGLENYNRLELDFCKEDAAVESEPASGSEAKKELKLQHWPALWIFGFGLDGKDSLWTSDGWIWISERRMYVAIESEPASLEECVQ
ncbi:unnamed protein product [Rhizophagus irregularis]|nr:unnamed protein product [Rhizophagus irregularis]